MEPRRLLLFLAISMAILIGWTKFVVPVLAPRQAANVVDGNNAKPDPDDLDPGGQIANVPGENPGPDDALPVEKPAGVNDPKLPDGKPVELKKFGQRTVVLGSLDVDSGFYAAVDMTNIGAGVSNFTLNDLRYMELRDPERPNRPQRQLQVVKTVETKAETFRTLEISVDRIDEQLKPFKTRLKDVEWEVVAVDGKPAQKKTPPGPHSSVTFRHISPDGSLEVIKKYTLGRVDVGEENATKIRDTETKGYELRLDLTIRNLSDKPQAVTYRLQGPVGLPLENKEHTQTYRSVRDGKFADDQQDVPLAERQVDLVTRSASDVSTAANEDNLEEWTNPFRYIGVDVQYFAALIVPLDDQIQSPYIASAQEMVVEEGKADGKPKPEHSDVSVQLTSSVLKLKAKGLPGFEVTHSYSLYAGPKREALLEPLSATGVIDFGWFPFGSAIMGFISHSMLAVVNFLHNAAGVPYGFAIILLTIMVRGCMFPISMKQAAGAKKMKELQPKIAELKKKYANEKDKFARAQMELFSKNNYNPLAGCLPIILQMPIFIGLYQALRNSVDLRMTGFMWFDNLAAPDALFRIPFELWYVGQDFNLLPLITVGLFLVQQKLFMPPPTDDQQAMQQKMMNYMMIAMGFMFYHVPAGLCVYFIASSLWGIGERKLLDYGKAAGGTPAGGDEPKTMGADSPSDPPRPSRKKTAVKTGGGATGKKGFLQRLFDAADAAAQASRSESQSNGRSNNGDSREARKKRKKSRR